MGDLKVGKSQGLLAFKVAPSFLLRERNPREKAFPLQEETDTELERTRGIRLFS